MSGQVQLSERIAFFDLNGREPDGNGQRLGLLGPIPLPLAVEGQSLLFDWYVYGRVEAGEHEPSGVVNSVLMIGDINASQAPLVRLHSACHTGDILGSLRCDCGPQLAEALRLIVSSGSGVLVYMADQEGRGIGLWAKAQAYILQDAGSDTYEANRELGYPRDGRDYRDAAIVLEHLVQSSRLRLLSNNPLKKQALEDSGFELVEMRPLVAGVNGTNRPYLEAKIRSGHELLGEALRKLDPH